MSTTTGTVTDTTAVTDAAPPMAHDDDRHERRSRLHGRRRAEMIAEMVIRGTPIVDIGEQFGMVSQGAVVRLVEKALDARLPQLDHELSRRIDLARLELLLSTWWDKAAGGDALATMISLAVIEAKAKLAGHPQPPPSADTPSYRTDAPELSERTHALLDAFLAARQPGDIARLATEIGTPERCSSREHDIIVDTILARLGDRVVQDDPAVERSLCRALVTAGIMRSLDGLEFQVLPNSSLSEPDLLALGYHRATLPSRYLSRD